VSSVRGRRGFRRWEKIAGSGRTRRHKSSLQRGRLTVAGIGAAGDGEYLYALWNGGSPQERENLTRLKLIHCAQEILS
jgi:hypothetical protein